MFRINEVNLTDPESLCKGGEPWVTARRAWNPQLWAWKSEDCLVQALISHRKATAMGTSCRQMGEREVELGLLARNQCSFWYATQLPKPHPLLSILPLCLFVRSFDNCCTASPSRVFFQGLRL